MSRLLSEGHVNARDYPFWLLSIEVDAIERRENARTRTQAVVMQAAVAAAQHKKGFQPFKKLLEKFRV